MVETISHSDTNLLWHEISPGVEISHLKKESGKSLYIKRLTIIGNHKKKENKSPNPIRFIFLHDVLEHHGRYLENFQKNFSVADRDLEFIFLDFEGHGLSNGTRGHLEDLDHLVDDLVLLLNNLETSNEFYLFGHGLGALVFLRFLLFKKSIEHGHLLNGFRGLIASNFYFDFGQRINPMVKLLDFLEKKSTPLSKIQLEHIKLNRVIHGIDLSFQKNIQEKYEADPLVVHRLSYQGLRAIEQGIVEIAKKAYFIDFPFLCLIGKNDPIINSEKLNLFMKSVEKKHYRVIELPDSKHDIYNDNDSGFVIKEILQWVQHAKK